MKIIASTLACFALCALTACGSDSKTPAPAAPPKPAAPKPQAAQPADPTAKMARAVVSSKSGAAVDLKYDLLGKPQAGMPIEIDLALVPGVVVDSMSVSVTASPGLEVVENPTANFGALKIGEVAHHKITVRADRADVVYLTVTATVVSLNVSSARTFAIPLIVTDPTTSVSAAPNEKTNATGDAAAKTDAAGQKIQPMPAQESK